MPQSFVAGDRDQPYLMPPNLKEWLTEDHLAWFVLDVVEELDLSGFYARYRQDGWGRPAYEPSMMLALVFYAYSVGVRSSREIERRCIEDVAFRVVAANECPDHSTIARFRQHFEENISALFVQVMALCVRAGMVRVGTVMIDGTKMEADASAKNNRSREELAKIANRILEEAKAIDEQEDAMYGDRRGDELPEHLADRARRQEWIRRLKEELDSEAQAAEQEYEKRLKAWEGKIEEGKAAKKPTPPGRQPRGRRPRTRINTTDPDSRFMKLGTHWGNGYNAQIVATEDQVIIATVLSQSADDKSQLNGVLDEALGNVEASGIEEPIESAVADAGYLSIANCSPHLPNAPEMFIAVPPPRPKSRRWRGSFAQEMRAKVSTERGTELMRKRRWTIEPIFGQVKAVRGFRRFSRRGLGACASEWDLITTTHNLLKLWRARLLGDPPTKPQLLSGRLLNPSPP